MRRWKLLVTLCAGSALVFGVVVGVSISNHVAAGAKPKSARVSTPQVKLSGLTDEGEETLTAFGNDEPDLTPEPPVSVVTLRARLRDLTEKRATRMTARELLRAIEGIEKTLAEQDAAADAVLMQGVGRLHEAVAKYPGTEAAVRSARALETLGYYVTREGRLERHSVQETPVPTTVGSPAILGTPANDDGEETSLRGAPGE